MSISINNTLVSIGICACAVLATFSLNGAYDAVQSVGRAAMIFAWPRREQDYLKHPTKPSRVRCVGPWSNIKGKITKGLFNRMIPFVAFGP
jgi:hypothetical protein